jgi:Putative Flp pilus-assembly TadE/G-like
MIRLAKTLRGERGAILVIVAVFMAAALALMTFVVDVGHWFEHRRHLQTQVDAGALAAGDLFNKCISASAADRGNPSSTANQSLISEARKYSGDTKNYTGALNAQVNNRANVTILVNSEKYANEGGSDNSDPKGPPCQAEYVDLKGTDASLPWFFAKRVVPAIVAHARVAITQITTLRGTLPLAVQDVSPKAVAAIFVNENAASYLTSATAVLATKSLAQDGSQTLNGQSLIVWDNIGAPASVNVATRDTGVIFALSGTTTWSLSGSVSTICSQAFVTCYAGDPTTGAATGGLMYIHGYSATLPVGTLLAPVVRNVSLYNVTCTDNSGPYFIYNGNCTVGVRAKVDFGTGAVPPPGAQVKVDRGSPSNGCPNGGSSPKGCPMTYNAGTGYWETTTTVPMVASAAGPMPITLNWGDSAGSGSITQIARPFSANDSAGPVAYASLSEAGASAQSLTFGTHNLTAAVGLRGNLQNATTGSEPAVILRFASGAASNSGALDCDVGVNSRDEIHYGCKTPYQLNPGVACPNATLPANCVPVQTGNFTGPLRQGMADRFAGCPANHWISGSTVPDIPEGDPRAIPMIVTSYGAFANNGSGYVPVVNFAMFYVTGWDEGGGTTPCAFTGPPANEAFPGPGSSSGDVWGHFMKYVGALPGSIGGGTCDFSAFAPCTPMLTD